MILCIRPEGKVSMTLFHCVQSELFRAEVDALRLKLQSSTEEIHTLRTSLDESRAGGDRLHLDNDMVVQNVNHWIREQKYSSCSVFYTLSQPLLRLLLLNVFFVFVFFCFFVGDIMKLSNLDFLLVACQSEQGYGGSGTCYNIYFKMHI